MHCCQVPTTCVWYYALTKKGRPVLSIHDYLCCCYSCASPVGSPNKRWHQCVKQRPSNPQNTTSKKTGTFHMSIKIKFQYLVEAKDKILETGTGSIDRYGTDMSAGQVSRAERRKEQRLENENVLVHKVFNEVSAEFKEQQQQWQLWSIYILHVDFFSLLRTYVIRSIFGCLYY